MDFIVFKVARGKARLQPKRLLFILAGQANEGWYVDLAMHE